MMRKIPSLDEPFWGLPTASIDWCESNYAVSPYIAEFWNTVSNIPFIILGVVGLIMKWRQNFEKRFLWMDLGIIVIGLGSAAFHGTLLFTSQLADELPMIWSIFTWCFILVEMETINRPSGTIQNAFIGFTLVWTMFSYWIHFHFNILFELLFGGVVVYCLTILWRYYNTTKEVSIKKMCVAYVIVIIVALAFWLVDLNFCGHLRAIGDKYWWYKYVGSFHGYWHILMAMTTTLGSLIAAFNRAEVLQEAPQLKWILGIIPYVQTTRPHNL